ncbi:MAG: type II toxin-antitoxin system RelE/ParE family toxin [Candidatus Omnitrophica bacterium]|nr:type II toxin-antitoxin system RelE/ParE family toxin [Candidatus Omnitrophota bacterium]
MRVVKRPLARLDTLEIYAYLAEESEMAADRFLENLDKSYNRLLEFPLIGHEASLPFPEYAGLRVWHVPEFEDYLVFYIPHDEEIEVFRVLHGMRDIGSLF